MLRHLKSRAANERGSVITLVVVTMAFLLVMGGMAIDVAYVSVARNELMRSLDAAALAGAGNLSFSDSVFPTVRLAAQSYGFSNPFRMPGAPSPVSLALNSGNAANGDIVLGIWSGGTFTPSTNGFQVNAVLCQKAVTVPASFLRMLGFSGLTVNGRAIAVAAPPSTVPPDACVFPMALPDCPFRNGEGGYGTQGCGQPVATQTPSTTNTSAWVNLGGEGTPNANQTHTAVVNAATNCSGTTLKVGDMVGTQGGQDARVYNGTGAMEGLGSCNSSGGSCSGLFVTKFNASGEQVVKTADETDAYRGQGWEVYVPVIRVDGQCAGGGQINGNYQILTFTRFVITQVVNGGYCTVANHYPGNLWDSKCPLPNGTAGVTRDANFNAVYGYFQCGVIDAPPVPDAAPPAALATQLRLVK
jgi:hypothetical protein